MADELLGSARFEIRGDASGATQAAGQANNALAQLEQIVATNWWGIQNLGMAFAALPAAVAAGVGAAVGMAKQWEDSMFDVARTTGESGAALDAIEASIFRVARTTPIATTELAALASEGAALGIADENLAAFAKTMGTMIAATDLTAEGVENVARVLNIMQVPVEEYDDFASALIEVGRNTAATESDIITASKRLATIGSIAGASWDQILGMGAAIRSLGPEAEAGSSAVNKTITDMANAIGTGAKELNDFAGIAGVSTQQFEQIFSQNAYDALALYLTGLGRLPNAMVGVQQAFEATNADGVRQQQALATLANGTRDVGNEQRDLNAILALSAKARADNIALQEIEAAKSNTLTGQLQMLRNMVFEAGASLGSILLPALKSSVSFFGIFANILTDVARGFQTMNPFMQKAAGIVGLVTFAIMSLAAGILLIGPRIIIAIGAMRQLRGVQGQVQQGTSQLTSGTLTLAQAQRIAAGAAQQHRAGLAGVLGLIGGLVAAQNAEAAAAARSTQVGNAKVGMLQRMRAAYGGLSVAAKRAMMATVAMTGAMIGMTIWMAKQGDAIEQQQQARQGMLDGLKGELTALAANSAEQGNNADATRAAAIAHVQSQQIYKDSATAAESLGITVGELNGILTGSSSTGQSQTIINQIRDEALAGNGAAKTLISNMKDLHTSFGPVRQATKENTLALSDYTAQTEEAVKAAKEFAQEQATIAQAHIDYIGALFGARSAEIALRDAEVELAEAREAVANPTEAIAEAERRLTSARSSYADALDDVKQAEIDLSRSRQEGIDSLKDAEADLLDARDSYLDNLDKIRDLEEQVAELRAGPSLRDLTKATNDLRNAQLSLLQANKKVSDSEWYLQYIREQGGSARDISDAELVLAEARQEVANKQEDVLDAEEKLADLRDDEERARDLAKAERDLAAARRESASITRDIRDREQEVADLRRKVANDGFYKDAQADLADAHARVGDALRDVREAEANLADVRTNKGAMRDLEQAQLNYETALYRVAEANTEVTKQAALMRGETWDAGRQARTLAGELAAISRNVPDPAVQKRMRDFVNILSKAPAVPDVREWEEGVNGALGDMDLAPGMEAAMNDVEWGDMPNVEMGKSSWWEPLAPMIGFALAPIIGKGLAAAFSAAVTAITAPGAALFLAAGAIVLALIGFIIFWFTDPKRKEDFQKGMSMIGDWIEENAPSLITGFLKGMDRAGDKIGEWIKTKFTEWVIDPFKRLFGIESPSKVFSRFGGDIIQGLINGLGSLVSGVFGAISRVGQGMLSGMQSGVASVLRFVGGIGGSIIGALAGAGSWLITTGSNALSGLYNGMIYFWNGTLWPFLSSIPGRISGGFGNAVEWLAGVGSNIVTGLWNGIVKGWDQMWKWAREAGGAFTSFFSKIWEIRSPSRVFSRMGEMLMVGLREGMASQMAAVEAQSKKVADAALPDIEKVVRDHDLSYLLSAEGVGNFDSAAGSARVPAGVGAGTTINYGDTVTINAETNASPQDIVNEYVWNKRIRVRG